MADDDNDDGDEGFEGIQKSPSKTNVTLTSYLTDDKHYYEITKPRGSKNVMTEARGPYKVSNNGLLLGSLGSVELLCGFLLHYGSIKFTYT